MKKAAIGKGITDTIKKVVHMDGWFNVLTGLGTTSMDKRMNAKIDWKSLTEDEADAMYAADDIAAKVCDMLPEDATREDIAWSNLSTEDETKLSDEFDRLDVLGRFCDAWRWARLHGGALAVIVTDDNKKMEEPLDLNNLRQIKQIVVLSRWEANPMSITVDLQDTNFGMPETYQLSPRNSADVQNGMLVHHSRLIRFDGVKLPPRLAQKNQRWGDSCLTRLRGPLVNYVGSNDSAASAVTDFRFNIFKMKNLTALLSAGKNSLIQQRLHLIQMAKSLTRAVILEEGEEYQTDTTNFTGLPEVLQAMKSRLQSAASMPHTKLFGESPSGLGATGDSEEGNWYGYVGAQQQKVLTPRLNRILDVIFAQKTGPFSGKKPTNFSYLYAPLFQQDAKEDAETKKLQAEVDEKYIMNGVLEPQEVRDSRFGGHKYSSDTSIGDGDAPELPEAPVPQKLLTGSVKKDKRTDSKGKKK